jgi:uncharacterized damage-inducible protein DinB
MPKRSTDPRIAALLELLSDAFEGPAWHGPALLGALRGVDAAEAVRRPGRDRHCIWELVLHTAYWKYVVRRRLTGAGRGGFPRAPSNFPALPGRPDRRAWRADIALLRDEHERLVDVVEELDPAVLDERSGSRWTRAREIAGVAAHDVYHTGQIQLLKRLLRDGGPVEP